MAQNMNNSSKSATLGKKRKATEQLVDDQSTILRPKNKKQRIDPDMAIQEGISDRSRVVLVGLVESQNHIVEERKRSNRFPNDDHDEIDIYINEIMDEIETQSPLSSQKDQLDEKFNQGFDIKNQKRGKGGKEQEEEEDEDESTIRANQKEKRQERQVIQGEGSREEEEEEEEEKVINDKNDEEDENVKLNGKVTVNEREEKEDNGNDEDTVTFISNQNEEEEEECDLGKSEESPISEEEEEDEFERLEELGLSEDEKEENDGLKNNNDQEESEEEEVNEYEREEEEESSNECEEREKNAQECDDEEDDNEEDARNRNEEISEDLWDYSEEERTIARRRNLLRDENYNSSKETDDSEEYSNNVDSDEEGQRINNVVLVDSRLYYGHDDYFSNLHISIFGKIVMGVLSPFDRNNGLLYRSHNIVELEYMRKKDKNGKFVVLEAKKGKSTNKKLVFEIKTTPSTLKKKKGRGYVRSHTFTFDNSVASLFFNGNQHDFIHNSIESTLCGSRHVPFQMTNTSPLTHYMSTNSVAFSRRTGDEYLKSTNNLSDKFVTNVINIPRLPNPNRSGPSIEDQESHYHDEESISYDCDYSKSVNNNNNFDIGVNVGTNSTNSANNTNSIEYNFMKYVLLNDALYSLKQLMLVSRTFYRNITNMKPNPLFVTCDLLRIFNREANFYYHVNKMTNSIISNIDGMELKFCNIGSSGSSSSNNKNNNTNQEGHQQQSKYYGSKTVNNDNNANDTQNMCLLKGVNNGTDDNNKSTDPMELNSNHNSVPISVANVHDHQFSEDVVNFDDTVENNDLQKKTQTSYRYIDTRDQIVVHQSTNTIRTMEQEKIKTKNDEFVEMIDIMWNQDDLENSDSGGNNVADYSTSRYAFYGNFGHFDHSDQNDISIEECYRIGDNNQSFDDIDQFINPSQSHTRESYQRQEHFHHITTTPTPTPTTTTITIITDLNQQNNRIDDLTQQYITPSSEPPSNITYISDNIHGMEIDDSTLINCDMSRNTHTLDQNNDHYNTTSKSDDTINKTEPIFDQIWDSLRSYKTPNKIHIQEKMRNMSMRQWISFLNMVMQTQEQNSNQLTKCKKLVFNSKQCVHLETMERCNKIKIKTIRLDNSSHNASDKIKFNLILEITMLFLGDPYINPKKMNFKNNVNCLIPNLKDLTIIGDNRLKKNKSFDKETSIYTLLVNWTKRRLSKNV